MYDLKKNLDLINFLCSPFFESSDEGDFFFFWKQMDKACLNAPVWKFMQILEDFIA